MTRDELQILADRIFPQIAKGESLNRQQVEAKYPKRNESDGQYYMRLAPSPTGELHSGSLYLAIMSDILSHRSGGKLILRVEDTDKKREIHGAAYRMAKFLKHFSVNIDEGPISLAEDGNSDDVGEYGPYTQSKRAEIYNAFLYDFLIRDLAYPCFMTSDELETMRNEQTIMKVRTGVYGKYAKYRNLSLNEILERMERGESYVLRFKSDGDFNLKNKFHDELMGDLELSQNDEDFVISKAEDGIPTYHFAHLIDDYLMRVNFVMRANEWVASITKHLALWKALDAKPPKYGHIMPINKKDGSSIRKLSKRKDPEAAVAYFLHHGYPVDALRAYLIRIANPTFDDWWMSEIKLNSDNRNHTIDLSKFNFNLEEMMRNSRGPLMDFIKLDALSSDLIASYSAETVTNELLDWAREFNMEFYNVISKDVNYLKTILNIERETESKRKDLTKYEDATKLIYYFFDELFDKQKSLSSFSDDQKSNLNAIRNILENKPELINMKDLSLDDWLAEMKNIYELNFKDQMKFGEMMMLIRKALTNEDKTPNLYYILPILGNERVVDRLSL